MDFKKQIEEDIQFYQESLQHISHISKDEWAFNYWVLDKLFYVEEELIEEKILDYNDYGIDAYEIYEETKEVYLIQNKYYSDASIISADYVKNDFLVRAITSLENGTYKKSTELQNFFSKYKKHEEFTVYLQVYITNNRKSYEIDEYIKRYNLEHPKYRAQIYYLDDIEEKYYGEKKQVKKNITVKVESVNRGTILNINSTEYKLENVMDAKYVMCPVVSIYRLYRDSVEKSYPIFDKNIREYLGNKGTNKKIYETLLSCDDRKNFFYYNNGITMICDKIGGLTTQRSDYNLNAFFKIDNPQIVNGCQTVSTIYEALKNVDPNILEKEYKDTFVMLKILEIDRNDEKKELLYKDIVKYNNSQNSIDEKTFVANTDIFVRLQTEFAKKGFLLLIKQSDKNKFKTEYKTVSPLKAINETRLSKFGINGIKKVDDAFIPLEKLLQVIISFVEGGYSAYTNKSKLLKIGSHQYEKATEFIRKAGVTNEALLDLYLLYRRAEQEKKESKDARTPIPYYLIDLFAKVECNERNENHIITNLKNEDVINNIIRLYTLVTKAYAKSYSKKYEFDYNKMIKQPVDYALCLEQRDVYEDVY